MNSTKIFSVFGITILAVTNYILFYLIFYFFPKFRPFLLKEGYIVETLTAVLFLSASLLSFYFLVKSSQTYYRFAYFILVFIASVCFLDEVGFGLKYLRISRPMVAGVPIDGVHDFIRVIKTFDTLTIAILMILVSIIFFALFYKFRQTIKPVIEIFPIGTFLMFILFIIISVILDLDVLSIVGVAVFEEVSELNAAFAILFTVCALKYAELNKHQENK